MFFNENSFLTIKTAQKRLLTLILDYGEEIEDTLEINNTSVIIREPLKNTENLLLTPIGEKHLDQMMLKPDPKLEKTHYRRLHNLNQYISDVDQIEEVVKKLKENPYSKRCVLTLWSPEDVNDKYALSWTFSQLFIRNNKLIITNYFRSCDIFNAFAYNCLGIANLQEEISKKLEIECGDFIVHIGSAHIYKTNINKVEEYLRKV